MFSVGCSESTKPYEQKIENIERIFMHEPGRYSIFVRTPRTNQCHFEKIAGYGGGDVQVFLYTDVKHGNPMWITIKGENFPNGQKYYHTLEFHVRDMESIQGGGWDHGKFGKGTTSVVQ